MYDRPELANRFVTRLKIQKEIFSILYKATNVESDGKEKFAECEVGTVLLSRKLNHRVFGRVPNVFYPTSFTDHGCIEAKFFDKGHWL